MAPGPWKSGRRGGIVRRLLLAGHEPGGRGRPAVRRGPRAGPGASAPARCAPRASRGTRPSSEKGPDSTRRLGSPPLAPPVRRTPGGRSGSRSGSCRRGPSARGRGRARRRRPSTSPWEKEPPEVEPARRLEDEPPRARRPRAVVGSCGRRRRRRPPGTRPTREISPWSSPPQSRSGADAIRRPRRARRSRSSTARPGTPRSIGTFSLPPRSRKAFDDAQARSRRP